MKIRVKFHQLAIVLLIVISSMVLVASGGGGGGGGGSDDSSLTSGGSSTASSYQASGYVQKGPFSLGSSMTVQELDGALSPTGEQYTTQTTDDLGSFSLASEIGSRYVEVIAEGYYFNEISGDLSIAPLTLWGVSDLENGEEININVPYLP